VEGVEERRACGDEDRPQDDGAHDAPEERPPLPDRRHAEVAEDEREDEEVVDRERLLDQEPREVRARLLAAVPGPQEDGEGEAERRPADAPRDGAAHRDRFAAAAEEREVDEQHREHERSEGDPRPRRHDHSRPRCRRRAAAAIRGSL
jgi:hypothetical protein